MILRAVSFCLCAGLAGVSALVFSAEAANHRVVSAGLLGDLPIGISAPLPLPFSHQRMTATADTCARALHPGFADMFSATQLQATGRHCADFANRAEKHWKNNAQLGLIRAAHAASMGDVTRFQAHLARAQRNAPYQGWQAIRRVSLTLDLAANLQTKPETLSPTLARDLELMLKTQPGAEALADHYHSHPDARAQIAVALRLAVEADQKRFFNLVRLRGYE